MFSEFLVLPLNHPLNFQTDLLFEVFIIVFAVASTAIGSRAAGSLRGGAIQIIIIQIIVNHVYRIVSTAASAHFFYDRRWFIITSTAETA